MRLFLAMLAVSGAALATPAKQVACSQKVIDCQQFPMTRAGLIIEVARCPDNTVQASVLRPGMTAKPVLEGVVKVKDATTRKMGAPMHFTGTDFDLSVNMTTFGGGDGTHRGTLTSQRRGLKKAAVTCSLPTGN